MTNSLDEIFSELILLNPTNRAIVLAYHNDENVRLDEHIYTPLGEKYSSLKGFIGTKRSISDPIVDNERMKYRITNIRTLKDLVNLVGNFDYGEDTESIKTMFDKIDPVIKLGNEIGLLRDN